MTTDKGQKNGLTTPATKGYRPLPLKFRRNFRFEYYNYLRRHRSLGRRTPASVYGLASVGEQKMVKEISTIALPPRGGIMETGDGCSIATNVAAVASVAVLAPVATAAGTLPIRAIPPYSTLESVQRMGTS